MRGLIWKKFSFLRDGIIIQVNHCCVFICFWPYQCCIIGCLLSALKNNSKINVYECSLSALITWITNGLCVHLRLSLGHKLSTSKWHVQPRLMTWSVLWSVGSLSHLVSCGSAKNMMMTVRRLNVLMQQVLGLGSEDWTFCLISRVD